jgi:D-lyxose ketol-isomerase
MLRAVANGHTFQAESADLSEVVVVEVSVDSEESTDDRLDGSLKRLGEGHAFAINTLVLAT